MGAGEALLHITNERVPEGSNDWKPHEKSMELGKLAALVATMLGWIAFMIENAVLQGMTASHSWKPFLCARTKYERVQQQVPR